MAANPPGKPVPPLDWARASGKVDLVRHALEAKLKKRHQRRVRAAGGFAAVLLVALTAVWAVPLVRDTAEIATAPARRQTLALADGSTADLNARTTLHTDFRYGRRRVRLDQGEAYFSVAKDSTHPFLVETPAGVIRVTGTKFNVRLSETHQAEVTLLEGSVIAESLPGNVRTLRPGQQVLLASSPSPVRTLSDAELDHVVSWRSGRLALDGLTLGEAVARFAAYHGRRIEVAPSVSHLRLGGSCPLDDLSGFMDFLEQAFPVQVFTQPDGGYQIVAH